MLKRCIPTAAPKKVNITGAAAKPKRVTYMPQGDIKSGKDRMTFMESIAKDREAAAARRKLPLWERFKELPIIPFIVFMSLWSLAGLYVVPWFKGLKGGEHPRVRGQELPEAQKAMVSVTPIVPSPLGMLSNAASGRPILTYNEPKIKL